MHTSLRSDGLVGAGSLFRSQICTRSPGRTRKVGPGKRGVNRGSFGAYAGSVVAASV